jgi:hypothetical protein
MVRNWHTTGLAISFAFALALPAGATTISLNFSSGYDNSGPAPTTTLAATDIAGVARAANWNNLAGSSGSASSLLNATGTASSLSTTWSSNGTWSTGTAQPNADYKMMYSGFDERGTNTATVTVSGLGQFPSYSVYAYFAADATNPNVVEGYSIGSQTYWGSFFHQTDAKFAGTYIKATGTTQATATEGANYALFTGLTGPTFTLTATPGNGWRAELMGIQIVGVPEPSSWVLMLGAVVGLGAIIRRSSTSSQA